MPAIVLTSAVNTFTSPDATPDIAYTRDRLGNVLSAVAAGVSTNLYAYSREGLLTNEVQNGVVLSRPHDALGRPTGYTCRSADGPSASSNSVAYSYDAYGCLSTVSSGDDVFTYSYLPGTDLVSGYASGDFVRSVSYEPHRDLVASVENSFGETVVSRFDYTNDALGRRTAIARSGTAFSSLSGAADGHRPVRRGVRGDGLRAVCVQRPVRGRRFAAVPREQRQRL